MKNSVSTWNDHWQKTVYQILPKDDIMFRFVDRFIPDCEKAGEKDCFEIGCYPGRWLAGMGVYKGYRINGIDFAHGMDDPAFGAWLRRLKIRVGKIEKADFFERCRKNQEQYDFVYSFGFIEHFRNFKKVIALHDTFVKPGGYLVISAPNYAVTSLIYYFYRVFHFTNLKIHYLPSMDTMEWEKVLRGQGYEIEYSGYIGSFSYDPHKYGNKMSVWKECLWKIAMPVEWTFRKYAGMREGRNGRFLASDLGIVARKRKEP